MTRKRKVFYPPARTANRPAPATGTAPTGPSTVVAIDTRAGIGRAGFVVGATVRILGTGLYTGETASVEQLFGGMIPAALVRTEAGRTRRVRTIDLEPVTAATAARSSQKEPDPA